MEKLKRFQQAFNYLHDQGEFRSKADCAKRMSRTRENVSGAYYGREPFFNDKFLLSFCQEYPIINYEWLINGNGEMLNKQESVPYKIPEWADTFINILSKQVAENEALNRQLKESIMEVNKLRDKLDTLLRISNYQIQTPHGAYLTAAEPK